MTKNELIKQIKSILEKPFVWNQSKKGSLKDICIDLTERLTRIEALLKE